MKTIFLAFFLLFAFSTTLPSTTANLVYDTDGEPLKKGGTSYHIIPVFRGRGGGLKLGKTGNETCPLTVVQARSELDHGLPATFGSLINFPFIREDMNLSISFTDVPEDCVPKPSQWDIVEEFPIGWSVKVVANERFVDSFKIKKYEKFGPLDYKLVYCPGSGNVCGDLGIHNRRLLVSDGNPFIVNFQKGFTESSVN